MSNPDAITTPDIIWIYTPPPDTNKKVWLLNRGGVGTQGKWGTGEGFMAWHPMPKRNKQLEKELGL